MNVASPIAGPTRIALGRIIDSVFEQGIDPIAGDLDFASVAPRLARDPYLSGPTGRATRSDGLLVAAVLAVGLYGARSLARARGRALAPSNAGGDPLSPQGGFAWKSGTDWWEASARHRSSSCGASPRRPAARSSGRPSS